MRKNQVAVVGAAETTELGVIPDMSQIQLHADAALNAIADAGLKLSDSRDRVGQFKQVGLVEIVTRLSRHRTNPKR